jgi:hypothetical protein
MTNLQINIAPPSSNTYVSSIVKMSERVNSYYRRRILSLQQRDKTGLK